MIGYNKMTGYFKSEMATTWWYTKKKKKKQKKKKKKQKKKKKKMEFWNSKQFKMFILNFKTEITLFGDVKNN